MVRRVLQSIRRSLSKPGTHRFDPHSEGFSPLRIAIQGLGTIGRIHSTQLAANACFELVGICSRSADDQQTREEFGCGVFRSLEQLLQAVKPDILLIATPHLYHHGSILLAIEHGVHVICEKPLVVRPSELESLSQAVKRSSSKLTVMSQTRFEPNYLKAKQLIDSGSIGQVSRLNLVETFLRTDDYYSNEDWRGTWSGEGGGVLVNQAPHILDRYQWLVGCPTSIFSSCMTLQHNIEVEDSATLICNHEDGLLGTIHVSTNEPSQTRLEVVGDSGSLLVDADGLRVRYWQQTISESIRGNRSLDTSQSRVERYEGELLGWADALLHDFYEDFALSIWKKKPSCVSFDEAANVVFMMNAAQVSDWKGCAIELPACPSVYERFLGEKCEACHSTNHESDRE